MAEFNRNYDFVNLPVVAFGSQGFRTFKTVDVDKSKVSSYAGVDGVVQRLVYPGCFAGSIPGSTKVRPIPRAKLTAAITTASTELSTKTGVSRNFIAGEELVVIAPYQTYTFAATWAADDTATATINGHAVTSTAIGADLAVEAAALATAINASPYVGSDVVAIADGTDTVYVYAYDMRSLYTTTASATTAGNGTLTAGGAAMAVNSTAIGTISAVDATADTITLSSSSGLELPSGMPFGVAASLPDNLGILSVNQAVDLEYGANTNIGLIVGGAVWEERMPYVDGQLKKLFPEILYA